MIVADRRGKIKWGIIFLLSLTLAFGLGRLMKLAEPKPPLVWAGATTTIDFLTIAATNAPSTSQLAAAAEPKPSGRAPALLTPLTKEGSVVASKSGTKYHLPDCPGAKQIKESNKISFASVSAARAAGYTPAANCPGLK